MDVFWLCIIGIALEVVVVGLLIYRRTFRIIPCFTAYVVWTILSDSIMVSLLRKQQAYVNVFAVEMTLDSILQFIVLLEVVWRTLNPIRTELSRRVLVFAAVFTIAAGVLLWPLAGLCIRKNMPHIYHYVTQMQQTISFLRIVFLLVLTCSSKLLSIGWRDRELQVTTGLGFYSIASFGGFLLHINTPRNPIAFERIEIGITTCYLLTLIYWVSALVQKEARRQTFTPEMEQFLWKITGNASAIRASLGGN